MRRFKSGAGDFGHAGKPRRRPIGVKGVDAIHLKWKIRCMSRTNINLDDNLIRKGMQLTGLRTKRELVDLALRELIRKEDQKSILSLEGTMRWEGNLDELRTGRFAR